MEWQPIETGPKDGEPILGSGECDRTLSCVFIMAWDEDKRVWFDYSSYITIDHVTAWMPLPMPFDPTDDVTTWMPLAAPPEAT